MEIKTSKGVVHLKNSLNLREVYDLECAEHEAIVINPDGTGALNSSAIKGIKEGKAISAIEKIVIGDESIAPSMDALLDDNYFTLQDFRKVFEPAVSHCNKLIKGSKPEKKS